METNSEMIQMMELVVKNIKRVTITLFHMLNQLEERLIMQEKCSRHKNKFLEMKIMSNVKSILNGIGYIYHCRRKG